MVSPRTDQWHFELLGVAEFRPCMPDKDGLNETSITKTLAQNLVGFLKLQQKEINDFASELTETALLHI